jgi:hypothetical protein
MKKRIVVEIDVPQGFDDCWDEPTGIQAFHDTVMVDAIENGISKAIQIGKLTREGNTSLAQYIQTKLDATRSAKIVGFIDDKNTFRTDF